MTPNVMSYSTSARLGARIVGWILLAAMIAAVPTDGAAQYFQFGKNKVQYGAKDWYYVQSEHFDVYYYRPGGEYLARFTADAAEQAYDQIAEDFEYDLSDRIPILIYQNHHEFAVTNAVNLPTYSEGIGGVTELFKNRVAIPFTGDYREFRRVIHHELVHAVLNDMFYGGSIQNVIQNNISLQIPTWFNEGLSEYEALGWDTQSDMYVREAVVNDNLPPIRGLSGYMAYRGGQAVWDYISEQYGRQKIGELLQNIRLTRSVPASFQRSTGQDLEALSESWHNTLKKVYFPEMSAREDLDQIAEPIVTPEKGNLYNTSPALSPEGSRVAFISTRGGFFDVYLARAEDGRIIKKLVSGQDNTQFESLRILEPNLTWSPDGTKIALSAKSGPGDAIAVVDVETGESTHYRVPNVDAVVTLSFHPDGEKIAFEGTRGPQSDIFVLDLETGNTINYTSDLFSDHEPSWAPNGEFLVFHSDRGSYTRLASARTENFEMMQHDYSQMDVYRLTPGRSTVERLTYTSEWDEESAKFGGDSSRMLFISDRNGIPNIYEKNLKSGRERPVTDVLVGVTQMSVSADGNKAALVSLKDGTPSIYVLKRPFDRSNREPNLRPTVWAQRVHPDAGGEAPALSLASESLRNDNPILRDATDQTPYLRRRYLAERTRPASEFIADAAIPGSSETAEEQTGGSSDPAPAGSSEPADSTDAGTSSGQGEGEEDPGRIDFRDYDFSEGFDQAQAKKAPEETQTELFNPENNRTEGGEYRARPYKISFSPDIIYGSAGYSSLYGVQGVTQMMFSDMLGNHEIFVATNLLIDLRNSDYYVTYSYRPNRIDWSVLGYHTARMLPDYNRGTYVRYRNFGGGISMRYPIDKFRRFDVDMSMLGINQVSVGSPGGSNPSQAMLYPSITYTKDNTVPGMLFPRDGHRFALQLSGSPASLRGPNVQFATTLADWRWYHTFSQQFTWAVRASAGASLGPEEQLFYSAGVSNWINRRFDEENGFPIYNATDFVFATPVMPMRGSSISSMIGSKFGLVNAEFRFPLVTALLPGPLPIPLYNLQGAFFTDVGSIWDSSNSPGFNLWRYNEYGRQVFDDLNVGAGFGLRTILLGYPVRFDWAWRHNGRQWTNRRFYFSIGLSF